VLAENTARKEKSGANSRTPNGVIYRVNYIRVAIEVKENFASGRSVSGHEKEYGIFQQCSKSPPVLATAPT